MLPPNLMNFLCQIWSFKKNSSVGGNISFSPQKLFNDSKQDFELNYEKSLEQRIEMCVFRFLCDLV